MKKPIIGILPLVDFTDGRQWMKSTYVNAIWEAGGTPLVLPLTDDSAMLDGFIEACDGFLATGGYDISPALYHQEKLPECGELVEGLDRMEVALYPRMLSADKPMLGICRGFQFLNVAMGGTLWQDLPSQRPTELIHSMDAPYDRHVHRMLQAPDTPLQEIISDMDFGVNSCHHQGICELGSGLIATARCEDGLIEAICMPGKKFVHAVQWHPEDLYTTDENAAALFRALVNASKG